MFVTAVNLAKKAKTRFSMVLMQSLSSDHTRVSFRDKTSDKREILAFDPYVQMISVYREKKKIRTARGSLNYNENFNLPKFDEKGNLIEEPPCRRILFDETSRARKIPKLD
ncbi:UNVERIFIED_CONTAM: hypothetical protein PYX00_001857 [Menopon gallinae]|uniref:Ribosomal protein L33 n=1 Tax=Menopon gallinae TaxID=328185 RepID=A0AAW2IEF4_9NEOP